MSMDFLVNQMVNRPEVLRLRQATVVSVETGRTCTVQIAGQTATTQKVRYLSNFAPLPGYHVWVATDGTDLIAIGHIGAADKTLAPKAYRTSAFTVPHAVNTVVPMQAVNSDAWGTWAASPNPSRLTIPVTGRYLIAATTKWADGAAGNRTSVIRLNGTAEIGYADAVKGNSHGAHSNVVVPPLTLTKGNYVELWAYQDAAVGGLDLIVTIGAEDYTGYMNTISLTYLGS